MANRAYLTRCDSDQIYPSFQNTTFNPRENTLLTSAGCVPLLWWFLFAPEDLRVRTFSVQGRTFDETAPVVATDAALERFLERGDLMNKWYGENGGLEHHQELFYSWISSHSGRFISIEWQEIAHLHAEDIFRSAAEESLWRIEDNDSGAKKSLALLSTIFESRRFFTRPELDSESAEQQDWWNYFRIMGDSHLMDVPWA